MIIYSTSLLPLPQFVDRNACSGNHETGCNNSVFFIVLFNVPAHSEDRPGQPCNQGWRSFGCLRCSCYVPF